MSRDYKKPAGASGNGKKSSLFTGILIGIVLALAVALVAGVFLARQMSAGEKPAAKVVSAPVPKPVAAAPADPRAPSGEEKPRFDFYTILPAKEAADPVAPQPAPAAETWYLQAGAFQDEADADNLKATLAMAGLEARIQTVTRDGTLWHRVRLGPFTDPASLAAMQASLADQGIAVQLVKHKEGAAN